MKDYFDYFELLATENKNIAHSPTHFRFAIMSVEEALEASSNIMDVSESHAMLLETPEGNFDGSKGSNMHLQHQGAFWIFSHAAKSDFAKQREVTISSFAIGQQILARIQHDFEQNWEIPSLITFIRNFDFRTIHFTKIGPVFDNCHGYRFEFSINNPTDLVLDPSKWIDNE
jgi:hypothetical protein